MAMNVSMLPEIVAENREEFSEVGVSHMLDASGCYVLTTADDVIVYIGQADNLRERIEQLLSEGDKKEVPWGPTKWVYYALCSFVDLEEIENRWLEQHQVDSGGDLPYFNED